MVYNLKKNTLDNFKKAIMLVIVITLSSIVFELSNVYAATSNSIKSIDVDVVIRDNGDIGVTQKWETTNRDGTEYYIPFTNFNGMSMEDISVSDEDGSYEYVTGDWDIEKNFNQKKRKFGKHIVSDGFELCFGQTKRGKNTYTISYTFKDAFTAFNDFDAFNIMFINPDMDPAPEDISVTVKMENGQKLTPENAGVWGFGYVGVAEFQDGEIHVNNTTKFGSNNSVIIMVRLNKGIIFPARKEDKNFQDTMFKDAIEGSTYKSNYEKYQQENEDDLAEDFWMAIISFGLVFGPIIIAFIYDKLHPKCIAGSREIDKKKITYWRDPIYDSNILILSLVKDDGYENPLISALMLKWLKDGVIEIRDESVTVKKLFSTTTVSEKVLVINKVPEYESDFEKEYMKLLISCVGKDGYIVQSKVNKTIKDNIVHYTTVMLNARKEAHDMAYESGYLENKSYNSYKLTQKGIEEGEKYYGYVRFLKDFTLINEKEPIEVHLWDDILIIATAIGEGEKVLKQFKEISPEYEFADTPDFYSSWILFNAFGSSMQSGIESYEAQIAYSGGGGSSSFSGGGGFSGGGSGGGSR